MLVFILFVDEQVVDSIGLLFVVVLDAMFTLFVELERLFPFNPIEAALVVGLLTELELVAF